MATTPNLILFVIRSLNRGGAERQLTLLAKGLVKRGHSVAVAVFLDGGAFENELTDIGVRIFRLGKKGVLGNFFALMRLARIVRKERPRIIHGYLSIPNILSVMTKPVARKARVVWGIRASNVDLSQYGLASRLAYAIERRLARFADLIIANSMAGKHHAIKNGFPEEKIVVISNGIDTNHFEFSPAGREKTRLKWNLRDNEVLVGLVARLDPIKDHQTFLHAASLASRTNDNLRFVCIGNGSSDYFGKLKQLGDRLRLSSKLIWAGENDDMPSVYSALDIAVSSSVSEGFSNTVAEAMACGLPCIVTDVGDSSFILGDTGKVVPPRDETALAFAIGEMAILTPNERRHQGDKCRARIISKFSIESLTGFTEQSLGLL